MILRCLILLCATCVLAGNAFSEAGKDFTRIGVEEGLSQSWVRKIIQDSHGFMWFGTKDGLNRYDGREFRIYRPESSNERGLGNGSINELYLDASERLWVCTLSGVYVYNDVVDSFEFFEPLGTMQVSTILQISDGSFLFGTPNGMFHFQPETSTLNEYVEDAEDESSLVSNLVWNFLEDRRGRLWVGTQEGLCLFDPRSESFQRLDDRNWAGKSWVQATLEDSWGRLWIGTEESVFIYELLDERELRVERLLPVRGQCFELDADGNMWIGHGSGEGLTVWHIDAESGDFLERERYTNQLHDERSLSSDGVDCIHKDDSGGVWIGTYGDGLNYYSAARKNFRSMKIQQAGSGLNVGEQVNSILIDDTERWIGTERGLVHYNTETDVYTQYKKDAEDPTSIGANAVYSIIKDSRGDIWFGVWDGGLNRYDRDTDSFVRYLHDPSDDRSLSNDNVFSIVEDANGDFWIGTIGGGLNRFDRKTETFDHYFHDPIDPLSIHSQYVNDIALDKDGVLWVSTYGSLNRFDPKRGEFQYFSHIAPNAQNQGDLEVVFIDSLGQLWLGTEVGLVRFDPETDQYKRYAVADGLPNNSIKSISEDNEGNLWITTNYGLSEFVNGIHSPEDPRFINFDRRDGLQENEFVKRASFVTESGEIWIGGVAGLSWFNPEEIKPDLAMPRVVVTGLSIFNRPVSPGSEDGILSLAPYLLKELELQHSHSVFAFGFSALVYPNNRDIEYAYMLEGFDEQWQFVEKSTSAVYTNIDPGRYIFRVKATNSDGIWGDNAVAIKLSIAPPWWMTLWFRVLFAASVLFFLFAIYRFRVVSLKRSRLELSRSVEERTRELAAAKGVLGKQNEELKQHRTHLEGLVSDRTKELEAARDKAEVSDRLKSAFIANMSHEIRTPLNAIMGFSQLIAMEAEGRGEFDDYSSCIKENTQMLVQLLNDIIDFSIFESERLTLTPETIDVWIFFHEVSAEVAQLVNSRTPAEVSYLAVNRLSEDVCIRFDADKVRLRQILLNLATNACKFTEVGIVSFGMSYIESDEMLNFWIKDTGVGIAASEHEAIFGRFHKIVDHSKSFARGTGLGLAICRKLSDALGFQLTLESEVGVGSVFTVSIPVTAQFKSEVRVHPTVGSATLSELSLVGRSILVAEDIMNNFTIVERFLRSTGVRLLHALDGQQAVDLFRKHQGEIDLLLFDIAMPNMGGVEALEEIRAIDPDLPAIALTAHAFEDDVKRILDAGFQSCLSKPIDRGSLLEEISKQLDQLRT